MDLNFVTFLQNVFNLLTFVMSHAITYQFSGLQHREKKTEY